MPAKKTTDKPKDTAPPGAANRAAEVSMDVTVEVGRTRVPLETLLNWSEGSLIELGRLAGDPVDVRINGEPFARGEVVVIINSERFGVRLTEVLNGEGA